MCKVVVVVLLNCGSLGASGIASLGNVSLKG